MKLTSFYIPAVVSFLETEILNATLLSKQALYKKAIEYFKKNNCGISDNVLSFPATERKIKEQVYLRPDDEEWLHDYITDKKRYGVKCNQTTVLMQVLIEYCYFSGVNILREEDNIGIATGIKYINQERLRWME